MLPRLNISPSKTDFEKVYNWLLEEHDSLKEGFYCNWSIIEKAFRNKELVTCDISDEPIGFIVWKKREITAEIDILEIRPDQRRKGIGKQFYNQFSDYLTTEEVVVIKLFCAPRESEQFWKSLGFIKYPQRGFAESDLTYYQPLIETLDRSDSFGEHKIELWDVEPHQAKYVEPNWTWNVELSGDKMKVPIIQPCNRNWNLRWSKNEKTIKEAKVKYFSENANRIEHGEFLFITELKE